MRTRAITGRRELPDRARPPEPAAGGNAVIAVEQVSKTFPGPGGGTRALEEVSLQVHTGQFVCILGPSGCGKSTLLHIVGGFEQPTAGRVLLNDVPTSRPGPDRGMVFQQSALFPWKTVAKNVAWCLRVNGASRAAAAVRAAELLELVGLSDFAGAYPSQLSGGMRQRASLARTLALDPQVLLMDEPFGALDALTRELMQGELNRIWQDSGSTVLLVTHDINEAIFLGDRVVVMSSRPGRIIEDVTIDLARPRTDDTKQSPELLEYRSHFWEILRSEQAAVDGTRGPVE